MTACLFDSFITIFLKLPLLILFNRLRQCSLGTLDNSDVADLVKRSRGSNCLHEARKVFKIKYETSLFIIRGPFENKKIVDTKQTDEVCLIDNKQLVENVWKLINTS